MSAYDRVAADYDGHFQRPIDRWEDERLASLLAPRVNGRYVLDLGCGTGWLLDHLSPLHYIGVDASAAMLEQLERKHPTQPGWARKATIGRKCWTMEVGPSTVDMVTATWAAHEFGDLATLLLELRTLVPFGTEVMIHGCGPRYASRHHYVLGSEDDRLGFLSFTPEAVRRACMAAGATLIGLHGTGATPDAIAAVKPLWLAGLALPARYHYAFLAHLRLP